MPVIPLTITVSLCLVLTFVVFFLREHANRFGNAERESLLPLAEETPRVVRPAAAVNLAPAPGNQESRPPSG
jgi:hypothetical protein